MDTPNVTDIKKMVLDSEDYFDIKTLFNRSESDPVNRRILYNSVSHKKAKGALTNTNETARELWPLYEPLGWLQQDENNAGDISTSFRTLFNRAITKSPNRDGIYATIEGFDHTDYLNEQYELLVDRYAEFDWIKENLDIFKQYASLVDTLGNIVVWDRIFNKVRNFDPILNDNFPLSLVQFQSEYFKNDLEGWQNFININQLTMYVDTDYKVELLWDYALPQSSQEFGEYLEWIVPKIKTRNTEILTKLKYI